MFYSKLQPRFRLNGGYGAIQIDQFGTFDIRFENHDENISIMKPVMLFQNIIWGMYVDMEGEIVGVNHNTGDRLVVNFIKQ